jgi:hypothetical protein
MDQYQQKYIVYGHNAHLEQHPVEQGLEALQFCAADTILKERMSSMS